MFQVSDKPSLSGDGRTTVVHEESVQFLQVPSASLLFSSRCGMASFRNTIFTHGFLKAKKLTWKACVEKKVRKQILPHMDAAGAFVILVLLVT